MKSETAWIRKKVEKAFERVENPKRKRSTSGAFNCNNQAPRGRPMVDAIPNRERTRIRKDFGRKQLQNLIEKEREFQKE